MEAKEKKVIDSFSGEYEFLSNYFISPISSYGLEASNSEAIFQAMKTLDPEFRETISKLPPNKAKRMGRSIDIRSDWDNIRDDVMYNIVLSKFSNNEILKNKLIETGDATLIEGNYWKDTYWGVCEGKGLNKLGQILMRVREEIKKVD